MSKEAYIISNGPSARLFRHIQDKAEGVVICVNKAAEMFIADYWCFCDWSMFLKAQPLGRPKMFTKQVVPGKLAIHHPDVYRNRFVEYEAIFHEQAPLKTPGWNTYSGTAALALLPLLDIDSATVFGVDMIGDSDCREETGTSRHEERWKRERATWDAIVSEIGIPVHRMTISDVKN